jgi:Kef-type K+ transport system membrane component KefB
MIMLAMLGPGLAELLLILFILAMCAFWLWMLIDCVTKEEDRNQRIIWVLLIAVIGIVGAPLYFLLRKLPRKKNRS